MARIGTPNHSKQLAKKKAKQRLGANYQLSPQAQNQAFDERLSRRIATSDREKSNHSDIEMVNPAKNDQKKTSDTAPVFGKSTCDKSQSTISGKSMAVDPEDILKLTPLSSKYLLGEDNSKRSQTGLADAFDQKNTVEETKINKNDGSEVSTTTDEGPERSISTSPEK